MTNRRNLKHSVWLHVAHEVAKLSTCLRLQVGAVLLRNDGSVAGVGYNGALPGQPHCTAETCRFVKRCFRTRHAERSALDYSMGDIATAYVTHEPCLRCTQDLIARGCRAVYYVQGYEISDVVEAKARTMHRMNNEVDWVQMRREGDEYFEENFIHFSLNGCFSASGMATE